MRNDVTYSFVPGSDGIFITSAQEINRPLHQLRPTRGAGIPWVSGQFVAIKIAPRFRHLPGKPGALEFRSRQSTDPRSGYLIARPPPHDALAKFSERHPSRRWWWQKPFIPHRACGPPLATASELLRLRIVQLALCVGDTSAEAQPPTSYHLLFGPPVDAGVHLSGVALGDLVAVCVAEPLDRLEDRHDFLEIPARLRVNGIDGAKHLSGEQYVIHPHPFNQQLHSLSVVDSHVPVYPPGGLFEWLQAFSHMHAAMSVPLVRNGPAAVRNDQLQRRKVLEDARAEEF